jgi:hypothetical protein
MVLLSQVSPKRVLFSVDPLALSVAKGCSLLSLYLAQKLVD